LTYEQQPGEVIVILRPHFEDGEWTGEMTSGISFSEAISTESEGEGIKAAIDGCVIMLAFLEFINDHPIFLDTIAQYKLKVVQELFPDAYAVVEEEEANKKKYTTDGTVIRLTRWSKTEGNA